MKPPKVDMLSIKRVLIIKLSALGDIIHALPVSAALGEAFPHLEISWAVQEGMAPLVEGNPYLDHIIRLPNSHPARLKEVLRGLESVRRYRFDLSLDLQGLAKSAVVALASGAKIRLGYHWLREAARLAEHPVPRQNSSVHIVDQYLDVARFLGAKPENVTFPFFIPPGKDESVASLLCAQGIKADTPFVAINPASAVAIKQWGASHYAALIDAISDRLQMNCVLVTADVPAAAEVARRTRQPLANLAGLTDLKQLAAVLRRSALHVCGDTGSGHLAAALGTPVVSIMGPTDPSRVCPFGQLSGAISHRSLCSRNCDGHHCQYPTPRCLEAVSVEEALARVELRLDPPSLRIPAEEGDASRAAN